MRVATIIEGHGEVKAVPVLIRRLCNEAGLYDIDLPNPYRDHRSNLVDPAKVQQIISVVRRYQPDAILILFDADDQCPVDIVTAIGNAVRVAAEPIPTELVIANREYEAWFIASLESLRGVRGVQPQAVSHEDPESVRDAKGFVTKNLAGTRRYSETADQAALTDRFDFESAYRRCRSFRRLVTAVGTILEKAGVGATSWPPPWTAPGSTR